MDYTELLPPLPEPQSRPGPDRLCGYSADQLRAAQLAAIAAAAPAIRRAERERCEKVCLRGHEIGIIDSGSAAWCAAAIRALSDG